MISNNSKVPQLFVDAAEQIRSNYNKGECDASVTELVGPPMISCLKREGEGRTDVMDQIYTLQGSAMHYVIEQAAINNPTRYLTEKRYFIDHDGWTISGQFDVIDCETKTLADVKNAAITTFKGGVKFEYQAQLNLLAYILRQHDFAFERLENWAVYRDWSKMRAHFSSGYKQVGIEAFGVEQWSDARCSEYLSERIAVHKHAREFGPEICTREERFQDPDTVDYCVQKPEAKRPWRVKQSREEAETFIATLKNPENYVIVERENKSEPMRCRIYCDVAHACPFAQEYFAQLNNESF